ncbi:MAG: MinD/ParA family protein [Pseudomonadota bacterium]
MHAVRVVAISGGKGGIGKTNVSVNLGVALSRMGRRTTLLDADLGLANVDVLLGLKPQATLKDVVEGRAMIDDVVMRGPENLQIVPAASGIQEMAHLTTQQTASIVQSFDALADRMDVLLIDTAAGITSDVTQFLCAAQEVVVVTCDEPTAITDAYALIKVLVQDYRIGRVRLVANMVRGEADGQRLYEKLESVCARFLDVTLLYAGCIPFDEAVRKAVRKQQPVSMLYPTSTAARAFHRLATTVDEWPIPTAASGHVQFFMNQLLQTA